MFVPADTLAKRRYRMFHFKHYTTRTLVCASEIVLT